MARNSTSHEELNVVRNTLFLDQKCGNGNIYFSLFLWRKVLISDYELQMQTNSGMLESCITHENRWFYFSTTYLMERKNSLIGITTHTDEHL